MDKLRKKLIFKKYRIEKQIYTSYLSKVYEGKNELTKEKVALKLEKVESVYELLESEAYFLLFLKHALLFGALTDFLRVFYGFL